MRVIFEHHYLSRLVSVMAVVAVQVMPTLSYAQAPQADGASGPDSVIVVTGNREKRDQKARAISRISSQEDGVLPRFYMALCPLVLGMPAIASERVRSLIQKVSREVGLPAADANCVVNVIVTVTPPGQGSTFVKKISKERRAYFSIRPVEKQALLNNPGPIWNWYITDIKQANGIPVRQISSISIGGEERFVGPGAYVIDQVSGSRLGASIRSDIATAFIVFDGAKANELGVEKIANLSAFLALAKIDIRQSSQIHDATILKATINNDTDDQLSSFDLNYLQGMYLASKGSTASNVIQTILSRIEKFKCDFADDRKPACVSTK